MRTFIAVAAGSLALMGCAGFQTADGHSGQFLAVQAVAATLPALPAPVFIAPTDLDLSRVLPSFPPANSLGERADLETLLSIQARRTPQEEADATADASTIMTDWTRQLFGPQVIPATHPKLFALMTNLHNDMRGINRSANGAHGFRLRPKDRSSAIKPSIDMTGPATPSYPSARTSSAYVWAFATGQISPEHAPRALAEAERIGWRRVVGGVHYPSDLAGSRYVADAVNARLAASPRWQNEISAVRAELSQNIGNTN